MLLLLISSKLSCLFLPGSFRHSTAHLITLLNGLGNAGTVRHVRSDGGNGHHCEQDWEALLPCERYPAEQGKEGSVDLPAVETVDKASPRSSCRC